MITETARKEIEEEFKNEYRAIQSTERSDSFNDLTHTQIAALNAESSYAKEAIAQNNQLLKRLDETTKDLAIKACDVIDAMSLVHDQKIESVNKLREWRKTIEYEVILAKQAVINLGNVIDNDKLNSLKEVVDLLERLSAIQINPLLDRFMRIGINS